jgi:hypothetical protein
VPTIGDNLNVTINLKWIIPIIALIGISVMGWMDLKGDIKDAQRLPEPEVEAVQFQMRVDFTADEILELEKRIEKLEAKHE